MTDYIQLQQPFVLGTSVFILDSIKKHEQSVGHKVKEKAQENKTTESALVFSSV